MARFMDIHNGMVGMTEADLKQAHRMDLEIEDREGVHFERSWLDPKAGKAFCLSNGPSKEAVGRVHERAGHPFDEVYEIPIEVS